MMYVCTTVVLLLLTVMSRLQYGSQTPIKPLFTVNHIIVSLNIKDTIDYAQSLSTSMYTFASAEICLYSTYKSHFFWKFF